MDKKAIMEQKIYEGAKYVMVLLWIVVAVLAVMVINKDKTLSIENINRTTIEIFGEENYYGSAMEVIELGDNKVIVSVVLPESNKEMVVENTRDYIYKLSKYKNKNYKALVLIRGFQTTSQEKDIIFTADIDLARIKHIDWDKLTKYEDVVKELNIKF